MDLKIKSLNGIAKESIEILRSAMKGESINNKLLVALFFMADLSDDEHTLENIEKNINYICDNNKYKDFQASAIRGPFNRETQSVKKGKLKVEERLWINIDNGKWKNSDIANNEARKLLEEKDVNIVLENNNYIEEIIAKDIILDNAEGEEKEAIVKVRVNQSNFREKLIKKDPTCKICGMKNISLLIASHAKSWKESSAKEKLDENNGFLLCPNHDILFDKHLISFDINGKIIISESISDEDKDKLNINDNIIIYLNEEQLEYINYHRKKFFEIEESRVNSL